MSAEDLLAGDNVTINIVFQNENNDQMQPIFCAGFDESNYMVLMTSWTSENAGPRMTLKANNGSEQTIVASADDAPVAGTWNMLTYVQEGNTCKIYLNGKKVAETDLEYQLSDINCELSEEVGGGYFYSLGAPTISDDPGFYGLIDDFRIYGSALTETEILELATSLNIEVPVEPTPTPTPTATPTEAPEETSTATPALTPTKGPEASSTAIPTETPTKAPEETSTATPTATPTKTPEETSTATPTATPTEAPEETSTATPTETPTKAPEETSTATSTGSSTGSSTQDSNAENTSTDAENNNVGTGDIAMIGTLLVAGAAALGGLKLRKKAK